MDWRELFNSQHHHVHTTTMDGEINDFAIPDVLLSGLSEEQIRLTALPGLRP